VHLSYLKDSTSQERAVTESLLIFGIVVLLLLIFAKNTTHFSIAVFEIITLSFILYLLLKDTVLNNVDITVTCYLFFTVYLYFGLKTFLFGNLSSVESIIILATSLTLLIYIASVVHLFYYGETETNLFSRNKSIFSILLASQIAMLLPLCLHSRKNKRLPAFIYWILFSIIALSVVLLSLTDGRSGWLGFSVATLYIIYQGLNNNRLKKVIVQVALPIVLVVLALLFLYKPSSSKGRLLIYKVSAEMLKDNWLMGIGNGQFKVKYNQYQAAYFATHNIDSKEALLADNTFYAFNDFYQIIIETGLPGMMCILAIIFFMMKQIKKSVLRKENRHLLVAAAASLICIATGSLFSYPLQIFPICFQAVVCLAIISSLSSGRGQQTNFSKKFKTVFTTAFVMIGVFLSVFYFYQVRFSMKALNAYELQRLSFRHRAINEYKVLNDYAIKDGNVLYMYAQELYSSNKVSLAAQVLNNAKKYYCSNNVYKLSAQIEQELQHYARAEEDYKTAVYMVPNRMVSRYDLLNFYIEKKDTGNIIYWSNSITNMPVKIPSKITSGIKKKAAEVLMEYSGSKKIR
jgi:O-antigen ligase